MAMARNSISKTERERENGINIKDIHPVSTNTLAVRSFLGG